MFGAGRQSFSGEACKPRLSNKGVDKTWAWAHGPAHGLPYGLPYGLPCGPPPNLFIIIFFLIKIKNDKHKKNKLKINFLLIYQLLMF